MLNSHWLLSVVVPCVVAVGVNSPSPAAPVPAKKTPAAPSTTTLQELHDLRASLTRLQLKLRYYSSKSDPNTDRGAEYEALAEEGRKQIDEVNARIRTILKSELGAYVRVSATAAEDCSEEHSSEVILTATADVTISKNELLLFHAGDLYRTAAKFEPLRTTGQGFFFRPDRDIPAGARFTATCIQNAPEELANVKNGFMPHSNRARDPERAYETRVRIDKHK